MSREFLSIGDLDLADRTVLVRVDINSPLNPQTGEILDDTRIRAHLPTINALDDSKVVLLAHQGRPGSSDYTELKGHARHLSSLIGKNVQYVDDLFGARALEKIKGLKSGDILLLENTRFYAEEVKLK
ncbi:MAG: phosphoglycerate kinase, partial [Thermoplasmata archaeon]|nr:phosphoglycerate kinase [Thermoplasmata archaeon]